MYLLIEHLDNGEKAVIGSSPSEGGIKYMEVEFCNDIVTSCYKCCPYVEEDKEQYFQWVVGQLEDKER